jgi:ATP adenylyltransferase
VDQLWAPWRLDYVSTAARPESDACFLCRAVAQNADRENLVAYRSSHCVVILNRYPYNNGHLLVAPLAHKAELSELDDAVTLDLQRTLARMMSKLTELIKPEGFNVGLNLGRVAGAGLPGHLHWHIVPRWNGDTNFMPVIGDAKVISQSLEALYDLLHDTRKPVSPAIQTN